MDGQFLDSTARSSVCVATAVTTVRDGIWTRSSGSSRRRCSAGGDSGTWWGRGGEKTEKSTSNSSCGHCGVLKLLGRWNVRSVNLCASF